MSNTHVTPPELKCPSCEETNNFAEEEVGKTISNDLPFRCPNCSKAFKVVPDGLELCN